MVVTRTRVKTFMVIGDGDACGLLCQISRDRDEQSFCHRNIDGVTIIGYYKTYDGSVVFNYSTVYLGQKLGGKLLAINGSTYIIRMLSRFIYTR